MKYLLLACSVLLFFSLCHDVPAQKRIAGTDEVLKVLKKYDEAWNKKDLPSVSRVLAPNYIYFTSTGGTSTRQETLDFLKSPGYVLTLVERSETKAFQTGDTVVVSSRWKGKGMYDKGEINDDQRCGQVFVRRGGAWQLISENCAQIVTR